MDYAQSNEVMPYTQPTYNVTTAPLVPMQPAITPVPGIVLNGVLHVNTASGWVPVGQQSDRPAWTRNPRVFLPAGFLATAIGIAVVIILGAALYAVVMVALAHAVAIGTCLIAVFALGLMAIRSMTKLRHGYPGDPRDRHIRY